MNTAKVYHYVYRITNKVTNKHYYGKRSSKKVRPIDDLGRRYFSSSTDNAFVQDQKDNPQNYKYKVVRILASAEEALALEVLLHSKFDVGVNPKFYNKVKQTTTKFDTTGIKLSEKQVEIIRKRSTGRKHTEEAKIKASIAKMGNSWNLGRKHSKEAIEKMKTKHKKGLDRPNSVPVNVYNYYTDELVAEHVSLSLWCKENKITRSGLAATIKCNREMPSSKYNPHQSKGLYAKYVNAGENKRH